MFHNAIQCILVWSPIIIAPIDGVFVYTLRYSLAHNLWQRHKSELDSLSCVNGCFSLKLSRKIISRIRLITSLSASFPFRIQHLTITSRECKHVRVHRELTVVWLDFFPHSRFVVKTGQNSMIYVFYLPIHWLRKYWRKGRESTLHWHANQVSKIPEYWWMMNDHKLAL